MSLSNAVINCSVLLNNIGYQLPGHGPLCEEAASIVKSDDYDGDIITYAIKNYGEFCGNNGYQLPVIPICAAAASIVNLMTASMIQRTAACRRFNVQKAHGAEEERMRTEEERMRAEEEERMRAEEKAHGAKEKSVCVPKKKSVCVPKRKERMRT